MAINYDYLMSLPPLIFNHRYSIRDTILYALGVGAGRIAAEDSRALSFVYEKELVALPTLGTVLAYPGFWAQDPAYGITWRKLLHRDQSIELHRDIPVEGSVRGELSIDAIYDRGAEKGALLCFSRRIYHADEGSLLATVRQVNVLRADGGFGGPTDRTAPGHEPPKRPPDATMRLATNVDQAMLYRQMGDLNPLHIDPTAARSAGFERPILHGLATFGLMGVGVVCQLCSYAPNRVRRMEARFSAPAYPGDTFEIDIWRLSDTDAVFEGRALERNVKVIRNGYAVVGP